MDIRFDSTSYKLVSLDKYLLQIVSGSKKGALFESFETSLLNISPMYVLARNESIRRALSALASDNNDDV